MKKVIGSVTTLAALVLVSYYGTGLITERTLKKNLVMLDQSSGVSVQIANYRRGLFTSDAGLTWQVQVPEHMVKNEKGEMNLVPSKTYTFDMPVTIYHGPVMFADHQLHFGLGYANSELSLPEPYATQLKKDFTADSIPPKMDLKLFVTYLNKMMLQMDVPAFRLIAKQDNSQLDWMGMKSEHTFSSNKGEMEGDVTIEGIRLSQGDQIATVDKVTSTYDLHRSPIGLFLGDVSINVPNLSLKEGDKTQYQMQTLQVTSSSDVEDGLFASAFHAAFEKINSADKSYGPGRLSFSIKNLDAPTLVDINQKMNQIQRGNDAERQQVALAIVPELPQLFSKGATIDISELNVIGAEGELDGTLHIALPKEGAGNPFQMIQKIEGEGKLKMPKTLLKSLMIESEKRKLAQANAASTVDVSVESKTVTVVDTAPVAKAEEKTTVVTASTTPSEDQQIAANVVNSTPATAVTEAPNVDVQAEAQADKRIEKLVQSGAIIDKGNDYFIDIKLAAGQFTVNNHPLNAEMLQF